MLKLWKSGKTVLLEKTINALEDVIKGYQKENDYLIKRIAGEGTDIVGESRITFPVDDEELLAGTFIDGKEESKDGSD